MEKKTYTKPTLTDHGSIVEKTKGVTGWSWEPFGTFWNEHGNDDIAPAEEEKK